MQKHTTGKLLALFVGSLLFTSAHAADISWSGFGSIVGGKVTEDSDLAGGKSSTYLADPTLTGLKEASYDDEWSFSPDTHFGLQMIARFEHDLSITAQITAKGGDKFDLEAEWLYASYELSPKLTINLGRQRAPFYMYSDFLNVGYAYHWLRPPLELYGEGIELYDGVSAVYQSRINNWDYNLQAYAGFGSSKTSVIGDLELKDWFGLAATSSNSWLELRASSHTAKGWTDVSGLPGPIQLMGKENAQDFIFSSLGAFANWDHFFIGTEVTLLTSDALIQSGLTGATFDKRESWMVTAGVRTGDFTPHITRSGRTTVLTGDANPAFNDLEKSSETLILGLRYNFHPKAAFKVEYTNARETSDAALQVNGQTLEVDTITAGIDFIF